jgi:chromate transport protein ChrA
MITHTEPGWYFEGLLNVADVFISIFIIGYAIFFISKTHSSKHRRPWEVMLIAVICFFLAEIFTVLGQFHIFEKIGLINVLKTLFIGLMLLVFTLTYELIEKENGMIIKKKTHQKK